MEEVSEEDDEGDSSSVIWKCTGGEKNVGEFEGYEHATTDLTCGQCSGDYGELSAMKIVFRNKTFLVYVVEWQIDDYLNPDKWHVEPMMFKVFCTDQAVLHATCEELYVDGSSLKEEYNDEGIPIHWLAQSDSRPIKGYYSDLEEVRSTFNLDYDGILS